jgi:hypothetical protein
MRHGLTAPPREDKSHQLHRREGWITGQYGGNIPHGQFAHGVSGGFAGAGRVRGQYDVVQRQQSWVDDWFSFEDVESRTCNAMGSQRVDQRGLIDHTASGGVGQVCRFMPSSA